MASKQSDAVKKLYPGWLTAFAESPDSTVGVQLGCRRGDLNDPAIRVIQRQRMASSAPEHNIRDSGCRSRVREAAGCHQLVLANRLQADTPRRGKSAAVASVRIGQ
jgi:hypothetical protein